MFEVTSEDQERQTQYLISCLFQLLTPGEEKTLRADYSLAPSPRLEDVTPSEQPASKIIAKLQKLIAWSPARVDLLGGRQDGTPID